RASVMAFPNRDFSGRVSTIAAAVDPATHRLVVRSEIVDSEHALRPGMLATFVIETAEPIRGLAIPLNGVVREGDGTMSVWVTTDARRFEKRTIKTGRQHAGYYEIIEGAQQGDRVATDGALLLSNFFATATPG
ncbi:MAG: efflux RND transporter periplasmic adaptor subunit, partial [Pseudolabrys sp.]|nr:efflux RND transporter periplasmic adaptor subunit [Pseudolabrys sp.]